MRNKFFMYVWTVFLVCVVGGGCAFASVTIDAEHFPDANFREYIVDNIDDGDYVLSDEEIANTTLIDVTDKDISSLQGVEYFTALISLDCDCNNLTELDVSNNSALIYLYCSGNQLTDIDVTGNLALTELLCISNKLVSLDVSKNADLTRLDCAYNEITAIDLSNNEKLLRFWCGGNQIANLDVTKNVALKELDYGGNQITDIDMTKNTALTFLLCEDNQLTNIDISKNTALTTLICGGNQLTTLDVTHNTALTEIYCDKNNLTVLDVSRNTALKWLNCPENQITALDVTKNNALESLFCWENQLTTLDVSKNTELRVLDCDENRLTALDVSNNIALTSLGFCSNDLTEIDVSKNVFLTQFHCRYNNLKTIDVSKNISLDLLFCTGNQLTTLDVTNNPALTGLLCFDNQLAKLDLSINTSLISFDELRSRDATFFSSQDLTAALLSTDNSAYPYAFNFTALSIDASEFSSRIISIDVRDASNNTVDYETDSTVLYFDSQPVIMNYFYDTQASTLNDHYMFVRVSFTGVVPGESSSGETEDSTSREWRYRFEITSGLRSAIAAKFGTSSLFQLSDSEIINDSWSLEADDESALTIRGETVLLHVPTVKPNNTGVYVMRYSLGTENVGSPLSVHGIVSAAGTISATALNDVDYALFDENNNEVTTVPDNGVVYVAMQMTAGEETRGVITTGGGSLPLGTITPIASSDELIDTIASVMEIDRSQIYFLTEDQIFEAQEPDTDLRKKVQDDNNQLLGKLNTLKVDKDGYYVFKVTLSDELFAKIDGVNVEDLRVYYAVHDLVETSEIKFNASFLVGLLKTWELLTMKGEKMKTGAKEFLMVGALNSGQPLSLYLAKAFLALLMSGVGCNGGVGIIGIILVSAFIVKVKHK